MRKPVKVGAAGAATVLTTAVLTAVAPTASASGAGDCWSVGDICTRYAPLGQNSAIYGYPYNETYSYNNGPWYGTWSDGSRGTGQRVRNNGAAAGNYDYDFCARIYYSPNQSGSSIKLPTRKWVNFPSWLRNDNASQGVVYC